MKFSKLYLEFKQLELDRDLKLKYLVTIIIIGYALITFFYYYQGLVLGMGYPRNTFLPDPVASFGDYFGVVDQWKAFRFNGVGYGLAYFPSTYLIADLFSHIHSRILGLRLFILTFFCFFLIYTYLNVKSKTNNIETIQNVFVCVFMTYPVLFTIKTANFEIFIFIFLCVFVYLYRQGKFALSSIPLAMVISMKVFPAVFLILFIADKKYKEIFLTIIAVLIFSLLPLIIFKGGFRGGLDVYLGNLRASQKMYSDLMIMSPAGNHFGHSFLNGLRIIMGDSFPPMQMIIKPYLAISILSFTMLSFFIVFIEKVFWKRITLLVISMCLLPYTSTDYKLLHFFIPMFLFINVEKSEFSFIDKFGLHYILIFSLLLIPKNYYYFYDNPLYSINNVLNPILMIVLLFLIIQSGLQNNRNKFRVLENNS